MSNPNNTNNPSERVYTREEVIQDLNASVGFFTENPFRHYGNMDSHHHVLFGDLPMYPNVVIKPFTTFGKAEHEKEVLEHADAVGFEAIEPLHIATEGTLVYLITAYREGLHHLGELRWNENVASRRLRKVLVPTINFAADFAGQLHAQGITHGDMQAKNILVSSEDSPVVADVENGQMKLSGAELRHKANRDLMQFGVSVLRRGLLSDRSIDYRLKFLGYELIDAAHEAEGLKVDSERRENAKELIRKSLGIDPHRRNKTFGYQNRSAA